MKTIQTKLEAPIALTPDQIAKVAAGAVATSDTVRKGAMGTNTIFPVGGKGIATDSSIKPITI